MEASRIVEGSPIHLRVHLHPFPVLRSTIPRADDAHVAAVLLQALHRLKRSRCSSANRQHRVEPIQPGPVGVPFALNQQERAAVRMREGRYHGIVDGIVRARGEIEELDGEVGLPRNGPMRLIRSLLVRRVLGGGAENAASISYSRGHPITTPGGAVPSSTSCSARHPLRVEGKDPHTSPVTPSPTDEFRGEVSAPER